MPVGRLPRSTQMTLSSHCPAWSSPCHGRSAAADRRSPPPPSAGFLAPGGGTAARGQTPSRPPRRLLRRTCDIPERTSEGVPALSGVLRARGTSAARPVQPFPPGSRIAAYARKSCCTPGEQSGGVAAGSRGAVTMPQIGIAPAAQRSYQAYVEHLKKCKDCPAGPGRCPVGQSLCRAYLADTRKK